MSNRINETKEHGSPMSDAGSRTAARRRGISFLKVLRSQWCASHFDAHDAGGEALDQRVLRRRTPLTGYEHEPAAAFEAAQAVLRDRRELVMRELGQFHGPHISVGQKELRRFADKQPAKIRLKDRADFFPGDGELPESSSFFACVCQQVFEDNPSLVKLFRLASVSAAFYCVKRYMLKKISDAHPSLLDMANEHLYYAHNALDRFLMACDFTSELKYLREFQRPLHTLRSPRIPMATMIDDVDDPMYDEATVVGMTSHEPECSSCRGHLWKGRPKVVWKGEAPHLVPDPDADEYCVHCGCGRTKPLYTPREHAWLVSLAAHHGIDEGEIMGAKNEHRTACKRAAKRGISKI